MALSAVSSSIMLQHMVDRTVMSEKDVETILRSFFDCMTGGHAVIQAEKK
jgi:hypothetical protein